MTSFGLLGRRPWLLVPLFVALFGLFVTAASLGEVGRTFGGFRYNALGIITAANSPGWQIGWIATEVQLGLLPKEIPAPPGARLAVSCVPALEVGGDFFDIVRLDQDRWGVVIGDVSGKGVPASLMMAVAITCFRAVAPGQNLPAATLASLNRLIHTHRPNRKTFVTAIYLVYDARDGAVTMANAGHPMPLLDGVPIALTGRPLGQRLDGVFREARLDLAAGQTLVIYSDGLEDVANPRDESFGVERVQDFFHLTRRKDPDEATQLLIERLRGCAEGAPPVDDLTLVVLQRQPQAAGGQVATRTGDWSAALRVRASETEELDGQVVATGPVIP